jgi:hypothetical protein
MLGITAFILLTIIQTLTQYVYMSRGKYKETVIRQQAETNGVTSHITYETITNVKQQQNKTTSIGL